MITEKKNDMVSVERLLSGLGGKHISLAKGEVLYKQNDLSDGFYLVFSGSLELIYKSGSSESRKRKINQNEFFGIEDILETNFRSCTAIATENSDLIKLPVANLSQKQGATLFKETIDKKDIQNLSLENSKTISIEKIVKISESNGITIVAFHAPRGNLNNAVSFKNFLLDLIDKGSRKLIVDLLMCKTFDSTFLGSLVTALKKISAAGGELKLVCSSDICGWLFVLTQMDQVFEILPNLDKAINSFENK